MDSIQRVSRPRGELTDLDRSRISEAKAQHLKAIGDYHDAVIEALNEGASFAEVAKFTGLSTNTLQRWKREAS